jgi:hypothetical protein
MPLPFSSVCALSISQHGWAYICARVSSVYSVVAKHKVTFVYLSYVKVMYSCTKLLVLKDAMPTMTQSMNNLPRCMCDVWNGGQTWNVWGARQRENAWVKRVILEREW